MEGDDSHAGHGIMPSPGTTTPALLLEFSSALWHFYK